ncbi:MAG TPA: hypothetical protein VFE05_16240 [Longimicrobiaceae bacterium]|jgi:hypothetical protein|nr:hypothetical protein [Longimicrobiaceae bacterium]
MDDDLTVFPTQGEMKTLEAELRAAMQHQRAAYERMMEIQAEVDALMERARILLERRESAELAADAEPVEDFAPASAQSASPESTSSEPASTGSASPDSAEPSGGDSGDGGRPEAAPHRPAATDSPASGGVAEGPDGLDTRGAAG